MVEQNFWEMLRAKHDSLTKSGTIVADYLVQHAEDAQYLSISSLAKACGVAEATIFRFCRSLGFDGYNEMKIALAKANAMTVPVALKLEPGVDTQILCTHAYNTAIEALNGTRNALDPDAIDQAATLLQRARQVFCFGQGGSSLLASDHLHEVPYQRRQPHAGHRGQPDGAGGCGAVRFLLRCNAGHDGYAASGQGQRRKGHSADPL